MLKQRIISGVLLAAIILAAVIGLPNREFGLAAILLFIVAGWEWAGLTSLKKLPLRLGYTSLVTVILFFLWRYQDQPEANWLLVLSAGIWMLLLAVLAAYVRGNSQEPRWQPLLAAIGLILLPATWLAFSKLHGIHFGWLLFLLALCVTADSMAYFVGKIWGKNKLAPELSPGKTREGLLGGFAGVFGLSIVAVLFVQLSVFDSISLVFLTLIAGLISVAGDLFESLIKREAGEKDSGTLLPGHGGVLDRFDSHIAAAPLFFLGLKWILG